MKDKKKTSKVKIKKIEKVASNKYSSFWFDDDDYSLETRGFGASRRFSSPDTDIDTDISSGSGDDYTSRKAERTVELLKLSSFMRSCANFVRILTNRSDIVVKYEDGDSSYTDGKSVTLSAKVEDNFDSTVGLALHEASHILLTDFSLLKDVFMNGNVRDSYITKEMVDKVIALNPNISKFDYSKVIGSAPYGSSAKSFTWQNTVSEKAATIYLATILKDIHNWIEDRRIDNYVYTTAPGYRGYYEALYNRYFFSDEVNKALADDKSYKDETMDSYIFRIINLMNEYNNIKSLKGLEEIKRLIDVPRISRLKNSSEGYEISSKVLKVILDNITALNFVESAKQKGISVGDAQSEDGTEILIDSMTDEEVKKLTGMSKKALKKLLSNMQNQKDFISGDMKKKKLSKTDSEKMKAMADSGVTMELAGGEEFNNRSVQVLVIKKITDSIVSNSDFSNIFQARFYSGGIDRRVNEGFVLGKLLGKKLQIRNEEKTLKSTRLNTGRIDKRLVAELGYGVENIFSKVKTDKYNKAHIHISIDASGSMNGNRIDRAVKTAVAIAVACRMTNNLECVISFRSVTFGDLPLVVIGYDSRINHLSHIRKYFKYISANSSTPESLCFEAMMNHSFPRMTHDEQFYFVNLSDGEPSFSSRDRNNPNGTLFSYCGERAEKHCQRMIKKMVKDYNATIISYFISDYRHLSSSFTAMYGSKNSFLIDTNKVDQIAKVMNKKFLEGGARKNDKE